MALEPAAALGALRNNGFAVVPFRIASEKLDVLRQAVEAAIAESRLVQYLQGVADGLTGTAHHVLRRDGAFMDCLTDLIGSGTISILEKFLGSKLILNSYGAFDNVAANKQNYVAAVHRDVRTWTSKPFLMAQLLIMLDDFTADNGATYILPSSRLRPDKPDDTAFYRDAQRLCGSAGTIIAIDSRTWHAAGKNQTGQSRRCLTLTMTPPFVKPQLDHCRFLGYEYCASLPLPIREVLGYGARTPATLEEWYLPPAQRFYQRDQEGP